MRNPLRVPFIRHVAMIGGTQATQGVLAMVAGIIIARTLGPSARGTLSVFNALGGISVLICSFGIHLAGVYFLGKFKSDHDAIVSNGLLVGVVGGLLTGVALAIFGVAFQDTALRGVELGLFLLYVISVPFFYFNEFGRRLLLGAGRVSTYNLPDVLGGGTLFLGTGAAIVIFGKHLLPLVVLRVGVEVATTLLVVVLLVRSIPFRFRPSRALLREQLAYGIKNYSGSLLWLCLLQSDVVLCNHFLGTHATGIYSVAVSLGLPITLLAGVVGLLTFQRVSAEEHRSTRIEQTNRAVRTLFPLVTAAVVTMGLLSGTVIPLLYGDEFGAAATAFNLLLPGFLAFSLEVVLMNFLAGEGSPPIVVWAPAVGLAVNVVANVFVIPRWGINGASVTSSCSYFVVLLLILRYYLRSTRSSLREVLGTRPNDLVALLGT